MHTQHSSSGGSSGEGTASIEAKDVYIGKLGGGGRVGEAHTSFIGSYSSQSKHALIPIPITIR